MSAHLPVELDVAKLVAGNANLQGTVPLVQFKRLAEYLNAEASGELDVKLMFTDSNDEANRLAVKGQFAGNIELECHRCTGAVDFPLNGQFRLTFVSSDREADALDDAHDPVLLAETGKIRVVDLLEDELILTVPIAPQHEDITACIDGELAVAINPFSEPENVTETVQENSFGILKNLKFN